MAQGSGQVQETIEQVLAESAAPAVVKHVGCVGMCHQTPLLELVLHGGESQLFARVTPEAAPALVLKHFRPQGLRRRITYAVSQWLDRLLTDEPGNPAARHALDVRDPPVCAFLGPQCHVATENYGQVDPTDLEEYLHQGGFRALGRCLKELSPQQIIEEVRASGLRGRGGAGFPTGEKWAAVRAAPGTPKYLLCNGDEGDPGAFMDRMLLESFPYRIIEGMTLAAYAVGARQAYIYLRAEYHYLLDLLTEAITQARKGGLLPHLDINVYQGAGAYVCGEESALMDSIEGKRGEVRYKPPFPPTQGLWAKPTIINNVETMMNIPQIILNGAGWFNQIGTERSKGTKVFSVSGDVKKPGVYELVLGAPLRELIEGLALAEKVKMIQIGGATGRIIPYEMIDTPLAFEDILGAGAVTVFDESRDIKDIVYRTLEFLAEESCGKCSPCREGTEVMAETLERFTKGEGTEADITALEQLSQAMMLSALCGLGQAAPTPVTDSLQYFRTDYESRIKEKQGGTVR